jgi:hypothetical protein
MSQTLPTTQPAAVARSKYVHVRSLLAVTCTAILGLAIAVVLLATSRNVTTARVAPASATTAAQTADTGARLDHRGLKDAALIPAPADTGARLDHRGLKDAPLFSALADTGARLDHRGLTPSSQR